MNAVFNLFVYQSCLLVFRDPPYTMFYISEQLVGSQSVYYAWFERGGMIAIYVL